MLTIAELTSNQARNGQIQWIGVRPERRQPLSPVDTVLLTQEGLAGDHYQSGGKRSVTLIQYEHLSAIASFMGAETIHPQLLRRNIVVSGINLLNLRGRKFWLGNAMLEGTGICAPCSRMEETLGTGGYNAVRGHGGITAKTITPGTIMIGDDVFSDE